MWEWYRDAMASTCGWLRRRLTPRHRFAPPDPVVESLARWRSVAGVVSLAALTTYYLGVRGAVPAAFGWAEEAYLGVFYAFPSVLAGMAVLVWLAPADSRGRVARAMVQPLTTMAAVALGAGGYALVLQVPERLPPGPAGLLFGAAVSLVLLLAAVPLLLYTAWLCARGMFNAADGHPLLPALSSVVLAAVVFGVDLGRVVVRGFDARFPAAVSVCLAFGGSVTVAVVALLEIRRWRSRGVTLRWSPGDPVDPVSR